MYYSKQYLNSLRRLSIVKGCYNFKRNTKGNPMGNRERLDQALFDDLPWNLKDQVIPNSIYFDPLKSPPD